MTLICLKCRGISGSEQPEAGGGVGGRDGEVEGGVCPVGSFGPCFVGGHAETVHCQEGQAVFDGEEGWGWGGGVALFVGGDTIA